MLEQRRAKKQGYITLKEASELFGYSPDYIGQLIRGGKIKGEQVYSSVAWVTTADSVKKYLQNKDNTPVSEAPTLQLETLTDLLNYALWVVIGILAIGVLFLQYIFYVSFDQYRTAQIEQQARLETDVVIPSLPLTSLVYE